MRMAIQVERVLVMLFSLPACVPAVVAQSLNVGPYSIIFRATVGSFVLPPPQMIGVGPIVAGRNVPFRIVGTYPDQPNFVVVSPSSGVTPALLWVTLNPNIVPYLPPRAYSLTLGFAAEGESCPPCAGIIIALSLTDGPAPAVSSVVSAATLQPGISPGEIVSILGTNLGPPPISGQYDGAGLYPKSLGNTSVTFNDISAPLLYVGPSQINALVPHGVAGQKTAHVVVTRNTARSPPTSVSIVDTSPGIFTVTQRGSGQGAILNQDGTVNGLDNPAPKGSVIQIWATGSGVWNRNPPDGSIVLHSIAEITSSGYLFLRPAAPVSITIGGQPADIQYVGPAPWAVSGTLQVNAVVPSNAASGSQPIVLKVGDNDNAQQQVTLVVQ